MKNDFLLKMKKVLKGKNLRIVFTEGEDLRIQLASVKLIKDKIIKPVLLGNIEKITKSFMEHKLPLNDIEIIEVSKNFEKFEEMKQLMFELRKGKMTIEEVEINLLKPNYFGTMLVKINYVDALLGGATYSTADTVRPALQLIKTKPGHSIVSSCFIMLKDLERYVFSDCAINLFPSSEELVSITKQSAETAKLFDINPKVALLSYSTKGSGKGEAVDKVKGAFDLLLQENVGFEFDGELQFDAAFVEEVGKLKSPNSTVAGHANVFIFPDINAGNIGYKMVERLGKFEALGPILQGLNAPICDLSRGCSAEDIYKMSYITAYQK